MEAADTGAGDDPATDYRELSVAAVWSLILGLLSPALLLSGMLIVVPLLGGVLGLVALRSISTDPTSRSGRSLALCGVGLAAACLAMTGAKSFAIEWLVVRQTRPTAQAWLDGVREGKLGRAASLTVAAPATPEASGRLTSATVIEASHPLVQELTRLKGWERSEFVQVSFQGQRSSKRRVVDLVYRLVNDGSNESPAYTLRLERYQAEPPGLSRWLVSAVAPTVR